MDDQPEKHSGSLLIEQLASLRHEVSDNTKATIAMSNSLRMVYIAPVATVAIGVTTWLFWFAKIDAWMWFAMMVATLTPFLGENFSKVMRKIPSGTKMLNFVPFAVIAIGIVTWLAGCANHSSSNHLVTPNSSPSLIIRP